MIGFKGGLALVTGAGQGIGHSVATTLAAAGARVILTDLNADAVSAAAADLRHAGLEAEGYALDVADRGSCAELARRTRADHGPISILVNNAGVSGDAPIEDQRAAEIWDATLSVNLTGVFNVSHAYVPDLCETKGVSVDLASIASFIATTKSYSYCATKGGVKLLTQVLARELGPDGIRVNAIAPGVVETPLTLRRTNDPQFMASYLQRVPLGRIAQTEEIAKPVLFLVSDMAAYITGVTLPVDGGFLAV